MSIEPERRAIGEIFEGLRNTFLEGQLILGGSSGLFAFPTQAPAFTEDLDFLISEGLVAGRGGEIAALLEGLGYTRVPETPTFTAPGRPTFDLVGYSATDFSDHLSPAGALRVMVFGDLGVILADPESIAHHADGIIAVGPAGFCAVKLMTMRVEKGSKDKLQALLVIGERASDRPFTLTLSRVLERFDLERRTDAVADAQVAFLSLGQDPAFRDHGAEGYRAFLEQAERGYQVLAEMLREWTGA